MNQIQCVFFILPYYCIHATAYCIHDITISHTHSAPSQYYYYHQHYYYTPSHIHTYTTLYTILLKVLLYYSYILYCYYTLPYSITIIHLHTIYIHTDSQMQTHTLFILLLTALPLQHVKTSYCTIHTLYLSLIQLILFTYCTTTAYCTSTTMCIQTI